MRMTRAQCVERYGAIDFATKYWPEKRKWIQMLEIPEGWFPNWKVLDTKMPVKHIAANVDIHGPLLAALKALKDRGLSEKLLTFDGCFNIRMARGSKTFFSAHSYGLAVDLNAKWNPMGSTHTQFHAMPGFVQCFTDAGFFWGGNFSKRPDAMHFTWSGF